MANQATLQLRAHGRVHDHDGGVRTRAVSTDSLPRRGRSALSHYRKKKALSSVLPVAFAIATAAVLAFGWISRDEEYLVPDSGAGYWLGVAGASLMLLLLLYPLRKRLRAGAFAGSVAFWFRLHMVLGVAGPVLILFHSNFRFGSLNSNVALLAMLIVAGSGVVGRYLYGKVHLGLYGRKAAVREILADAATLQHSIGDEFAGCSAIVAQMNAFAERAAAIPKGILAATCSLVILAVRARLLRTRLKGDARRLTAAEGKRRGWPRRLRAERRNALSELVTLQIAAVRKAAAFELYDRLFGLWHVLHLPLFFILLLAAVIHVVAAHFY
jgi:hypothetical protein